MNFLNAAISEKYSAFSFKFFVTHWYRNFNGNYHKATEDYIETGKAICGVKITFPAFIAYHEEILKADNKDAKFIFLKSNICKNCKRQLKKANKFYQKGY